MSIFKILIAIFITWFFANVYEVKAQQKTLEQVEYGFGKHWFSEPDSMSATPLDVVGIVINDSCENKSFMAKFDSVLPKLINVEFIRLGGTDCFDNSPGMIHRFLTLPKLNTIVEDWACIPSNTIFPEHIRRNLINLGCRAPDNEDSRAWLVNLFQLDSLKDLSVFLRGDTQIDSGITRLKNLERLYLCGTGDIRFPENFHALDNLKEFTINHCFSCRTFPDSLPLSVEKISIYASGIKDLCSNLRELKNLRYLNIVGSRVVALPEDFNFSQLHFFGASEKMFTPEQWKEIEAKVGNIRKY